MASGVRGNEDENVKNGRNAKWQLRLRSPRPEKVVGGGLVRRPRLNYLTRGPSETPPPPILPCATLLFAGTILLRKFNFTLNG